MPNTHIEKLNLDGTARAIKDTVHGDATQSASGFMSATDKTKLDGIASGAEVNVQADWNAASGDAQILNKPGDATTSTAGFMSAADKTKLDGINTFTDFVEVSYKNNFSRGKFGSGVKYSKYNGVVYLYGYVKCSSDFNSNAVFATLPVGFRNAFSDNVFANTFIGESGSDYTLKGRLIINTNGDLAINPGSTMPANTIIYIPLTSFYAGN